MSMRDNALALAAKGYRVFPCIEGGKEPKVKAFYDVATSDPDAVAAMWTEEVTGWSQPWNIGVDCSDMIVVDIDTKNGVDGLSSYMDLDLPLDTFMVRTPSGGFHAFFSGPPKSLSVGKLGPGLDIRSYHGYVLGAGSEIGGKPYVIDNDAPRAPAPAHLIQKLDEPKERSGAAAVTELDGEFAIARATKYLRSEAPLAFEGQGGDALTFKVACIVKDMGLSETATFDLMAANWNDRCYPPWDLYELQQKVGNAYAYALSAAGGQSPEVDFGNMAEVLEPVYKERAPVDRRWQQHGDELNFDASWMFFETLPQNGVGVLSGPSQGGKTFVLMHLARSLATGKPFFGVTPDDLGGSIILTGEGRRSVLARMSALGEEGRLPIVAGDIDNLSEPGALDALAADLKAKMDQMHSEFGMPVRLIAIDTLSASGLLRDENDNSEAGLAMKALSKLSEMLNAFVLVTHHPPKDGKGQRGAGAIYNDVDVVLEVVRDKLTNSRELHVAKARDAQQRKLGIFTLVPVPLGTDSRNRPITSCYVSDVAQVGPSASDKVPKNVPLLMDSIEFALVDNAVDIEGEACAYLEEVKSTFKERYTGSLDASNFNKAWNSVLSFARESGLVKVIDWNGRYYLTSASFS